MRGRLRLASLVVGLVALSAPAHADLVFFSSGRSLSVKSYSLEGEQLVLALRGGGEIVCDRSVIARIEPDEVPYPEPEPPASAPAAVSTVPYGEIIDRVANEQGIDARLVKAVIQVESGFQQRARSQRGAMGLMQLMPETARQYGLVDPYDVGANIEAGVRHLKSLMQRLPLALALAAYNAGEAAVRRFGGIPPYAETREYVSRILGLVGR